MGVPFMSNENQAPTPRQRSPITIQGESQRSVVLTPTAELSELLDHAALINKQTPETFHYSLGALLLAFAYGKHGISAWFDSYISKVGVDVAAILSYEQFTGGAAGIQRLAVQPVDIDSLYPGGSRTATASALDWIERAKRFSEEQGRSWVGLRHMMGAVIFMPGFHEKELHGWGFARPRWAFEYLGFMEQKIPADFEFWKKVNERTFRPASNPSTYLLTWNPDGFPFLRFKEKAEEVKTRGRAELGWSTGNRTSVSVGDRVFLMRQGAEPRGLVGAGEINSGVTTEPHWDDDKRKQGQTYNRVLVDWHTLGETPVLRLDKLIARTGEADLWNAQSGGIEIPKELAKRLEAVWREVTTQTIVPLAWVDSDAVPVIGDLSAYQPSKHDSLEAATQAKIFATLLVAGDVQPPFAIGLLGDWGVGKTFFMRLMQETVASIAGKGARAERDSDFVSRAAQIEFNAWHYVDSDLWASLASHVFDGLSEELRGPNDSVEDTRRRIRRRIRSSQRERGEAAAAIQTAQTERRTAARELENKQAERVRMAANCESHRLKRVWEAVLRVKPDPTKPEQGNWPNVAELKDKAQRTAKRLGLTTAINSAEEVRRVHDAMRDLTRRGAGLAAAFSAAFTGNRVWISGGVLGLLLALVVCWPWILERIESSLGVLEKTGARLLAPLLQLMTIVGGAAIWATRNLKAISSAMGYLERIQVELGKPRIQLSVATKEEQDLKANLEKCDAEIATEQRRVEEADRQIAEAQAEIQRINAGGLVYDFLEGRVRDSRYLDRLGLISVIRQDFEKLGALLRDWRKHGPGDVGEAAPSDEHSRDARPIERIILYIDDLDRCPPERVVEVLQAVHLILAFDLFVVVVAVDARWLERSLNEAYNPRKAVADGSPAEEPMHRFNAHNYLEKIFQIPFTLPLMDEGGYRKLVVDIVTTPQMRAAAKAEATKPHGPGPDPAPATPGKEVPLELDQKSVGPGKKQLEGQEEQRQMERERREQEESEARKLEQEETHKRIEAMMLRDYEEKFIQALFRFIETPRLAKRFVNIYRLLRVRAATLEENFLTFIDREQGEYRAVLLLLAIVVGRAQVAREVLDCLHTAKGTSFRACLEKASGQYETERARLSTERIAQVKSDDTASLPSSRESRLVELKDATQEICGSIEALVTALNKLEGPSFDDRLDIYTKWASEVGRYSFRWDLKKDLRSSTPQRVR